MINVKKNISIYSNNYIKNSMITEEEMKNLFLRYKIDEIGRKTAYCLYKSDLTLSSLVDAQNIIEVLISMKK